MPNGHQSRWHLLKGKRLTNLCTISIIDTSIINPFSPVLAALTTQSQIILYQADSNQFKGPWRQSECLTSGNMHITAMTWAVSNPNCSWLLAGTRQGEVHAWSVKAGGIVESKGAIFLVNGEVVSLYGDQIGHLAVVTEAGIHLIWINCTLDTIAIEPTSQHIAPLNGAHISVARWSASAFVYCTPGEVNVYEVDTQRKWSILLQDNGEEEGCSLRPAVCESTR
jgi:hypothetical protein